MVVNLGGIELGDDELMALGVALHGKRKRASRQDVKTWALKLIGQKLAQENPNKSGPTELKAFTCPKCSRPISLPVPCVKSQGPDNSKLKELATMAKKAADALEAMAARCEL